MTDDRERGALLRLPATTLPALHRALADGRSPGEGARLVRQLGFETGEGFFAAFEAWIDGDARAVSQDAFWTKLAEFFSSLGWGPLRYEALHPGVGSLSSERWAEAEGQDTAQPTCHFTTGVLADLLTRVAGTDLAVMEVECRARGDDLCRFLIGSPDALTRIYEQLRAGESYAAALGRLS